MLVTGKNRCDRSRDADTLMRLVVGCEFALRLMIILGLKTAYSRHKWWKPRLLEKYQLLGENRSVDAVRRRVEEKMLAWLKIILCLDEKFIECS